MRVEYRNAVRRCPSVPMDVIDSMTEALAGKMLDISATGMKIITTTPLAIDALFQWRFPMPDTLHTEIVECGIQVIWRNSNNPEHYAIGARFIQIDPQVRERIRHWCSQAPA